MRRVAVVQQDAACGGPPKAYGSEARVDRVKRADELERAVGDVGGRRLAVVNVGILGQDLPMRREGAVATRRSAVQ